MARVGVVIASASLLGAQALSHDALRTKSALQPELAAKSLVAMEDEWQAEAGIFAECEVHGETEARKECVEATKHFKASCDKVVLAVVQGSSGDRDSVNQYMEEVCQQDVMQDWHKERCLGLASDVGSLMTADSFENRNMLRTADFCSKMWERVVAAEKGRAQEEANQEAQAAEEVKEEELKKQQEAEAIAKAQVEAEAKKEEAKKRAEVAKPEVAAASTTAAPVALASQPVAPVASVNATINTTEVKK